MTCSIVESCGRVRPEWVAFPQSGFSPARTPNSLESKATGVRSVRGRASTVLALYTNNLLRRFRFVLRKLAKSARASSPELLMSQEFGINAKNSPSIQLGDDLVPVVNFLDAK
jgi:hypothetical protein